MNKRCLKGDVFPNFGVVNVAGLSFYFDDEVEFDVSLMKDIARSKKNNGIYTQTLLYTISDLLFSRIVKMSFLKILLINSKTFCIDFRIKKYSTDMFKVVWNVVG